MQQAFLNPLFGFNRKIALRLTPFFLKTPLRPNHVTTLSLVAGVLAGYLFSYGRHDFFIYGAAFLQLSYILDNCDGEVARAKGMISELGMWYDYVSDLLVEMALWVGLAVGTIRQGFDSKFAYILLGLAITGSVLNFGRVVVERAGKKRKPVPEPQNAGPLVSATNLLRDDGDPTIFIWLFAILGYPGYMLFFGTIYIHFLWALSLFKPWQKDLR